MTPMSRFEAHWPVVSALLDEALSLPAQERAGWLEGLAGERALHRETVRKLLSHQASVETDDFLNVLPTLEVESEASPGGGLAGGGQVGAYRLTAELGRGGMGTVWLAERSDAMMKRRVALKLPRLVWGDTFAERLGREREILATLEHEHIARLYDAGVDAQGRPFLAMEYVEGGPIDAYCRDRSLPLRERIALLLQVMAAVAHAHARLVVHRDLKPGNILVSGDGQVKLLDFGVAKLLEGDRTRETALTQLGGRALTLDYASPEQIRGEPLGTASDVYSMAVVAYELLAGARPYRLKRASASELEEAIATVEPPLASASATDPQVARPLRGDLDSILNKALRKAPGDRYATMDAFAHDLQRYLAGEPVEARPDGLAYRASKFVRRHRLQVAAGSLVAFALVVGTSVALWQAREARQAAATATAVQGFIESVFNANSGNQVDPVSARQTTARELLDRGADRVDKELASAPEAQVRLYDMLAEMYESMSLNERSLALRRQALALATRLHGKESPAALAEAAGIGYLLNVMGRTDDATAVLLEADKLAGGRGVDRDRIRMLIDTNLAAIYFNSDLPKGLERARRAAAAARASGPSLEGITALHSLGENARRSGSLEEARQALLDAVAWIDLQPHGVAREMADVLSALGDVQGRLGRPELAGEAYARALAAEARIGDPISLRATRLKFARYQYDNGLLREAVATAGSDAAWVRGLAPKNEFGALPARVALNYGQTLVAYGDAERGLAAIQEAYELLPKQASDWKAPLYSSRADALTLLGHLDEAAADLERAMSAVTGRGDPRVGENVRRIRRRYWVAAGRAGEALQEFATTPAQAGDATGYSSLRRQAEGATLLLAAGHDAEAQAAAERALSAIDKLPTQGFIRDAQARLTAVLGQALLNENRAAQALPVLEKALALYLAEYDPLHHPAVAKIRLALAEAKRREGG